MNAIIIIFKKFYMDHSIAIYKYVFNSKRQYRSDLQIVIRTTPHVNILRCFQVDSIFCGQQLKPLYVTNKKALQFVIPLFDIDRQYFMVISDKPDLVFPFTTSWHDLQESLNSDFDNPCIIKKITPTTTFWNELWDFLNMEL